MKNLLNGMIAVLGFLVVLPMNLTIQYMVYKHIEAPQTVWTLWIIQIPLLVVFQILSVMVKNAKDK